MRRATQPRRLLALTCVFLALALLAACGPAPSPTPTPAPSKPAATSPTAPAKPAAVVPTAAPAPTKPAALTKVIMARSIAVIDYASIDVALGKNYFKDEGLEIDIQQTESGVIAAQAVAGDSAHFSVNSVTEFGSALDKGLDMVAFYSTSKAQTMNVAVRKEIVQEKRLTKQSPLADRVKALKGLKLGITRPGALTDTGFRWLLKKYGMDAEKDVDLVSVGGVSSLVAGLQQRRIDAFLVSPPGPEQTEAGGYGVVLITADEIPGWSNLVPTVALAKRDFVDKNPATIQKIARALGRANNFMRDRPLDEVVQVLQPSFSSIDPAVLRLSVDNVRKTIAPDGRMTKEGWENALVFLQEAGLIKRPFDITEDKTWTNRFLRDVPK